MKKRISVIAGAFLFLALFTAQMSSAQMAEVKVGKGTLKIGGILQAGFTFNMEDEEEVELLDLPEFSNSFTLNRARILLWGEIIPKKVKFFVQTDHNLGTSILDYKAQFFYIEKTEIAFGRFLPNFTLYMPYSTAALEMINYPLTTQRYAVWRQVGIQTTTKTEYVDFNVGIFNGYPANNFSDDNDAKDFLARVEFKPPIEKGKVTVGGYAWLGNAKPPGTYGGQMVDNPDENTLKTNRFGGFAKADYKASADVTVKFRGEFLMASTEGLCYAHVDSVCTVDGQAFFVHAAVQPSPNVEILARYDFYDPDKDMEFVKDGTNDDEEAWLTIGLNYYLEGLNSMFYLNFIHKMEPGQKNVWDSDQGGFIAEDREFDNDQIVAQVQILF